ADPAVADHVNRIAAPAAVRARRFRVGVVRAAGPAVAMGVAAGGHTSGRGPARPATSAAAGSRAGAGAGRVSAAVTPLVEVRDVGVDFGGLKALDGVDLDVPKG